MRLIDADALSFDYSGLAYIYATDFKGIARHFFEQVRNAPTVIDTCRRGTTLVNNTEICNGKITSTMLGREDHGIMTFDLTIEFDNSGCCYGGYALDGYDQYTKKRTASAKGLQAIIEILNCAGVDKWEDLPGTYIRVEHNGWGGKITRIGHLMKDKWFSLEDFFKSN